MFLENLSDVNNKISKSRDTLQHISDKVKCEQQILQTENDRLESINNECNSLGVTEIELNDEINKTKEQLTQVYKGNLTYCLYRYIVHFIFVYSLKKIMSHDQYVRVRENVLVFYYFYLKRYYLFIFRKKNKHKKTQTRNKFIQNWSKYV